MDNSLRRSGGGLINLKSQHICVGNMHVDCSIL